MNITLHGTAKQLIERLVAQGKFPSAESAVSSLIMRSAEFSDLGRFSSSQPDELVAFDVQNDIPHFPRYGQFIVIKPRLATLPRLPDPIFD